jgi:dienelactone hydrolase
MVRSLVLIAIASMMQAFLLPALVAERYDPMTRELIWPDLQYTVAARAAGEPYRSELYRPEGSGPFPAVVIMPGCDRIVLHDWIRALVASGYVVLAVDPLTPRNVYNNCRSPLPVPLSRLLKDAVDGGHFLETLSFVQPTRIAIVGYSQGGQIVQALTGSPYLDRNAPLPFVAMVGVSTICRVENYSAAQRPYPVDMQFLPEKVVMPLFVGIAEKAQTMCQELLEVQKAQGAPVEFRIYEGAPHMWMSRFGYTKQNEQAIKDMLSFLDRNLKGSP